MTTATAPTFAVRCRDGQTRHPEPFTTREDAERWAEWEHACLNGHQIVTVHHVERGTIKVSGFATADRQGHAVREDPGFDRDVRLMVQGQAGVGFGLGAVDEDQWYNLGPGRGTAQGPRVYAYGHAGVIDNRGGSAREIQEARQAGLLLEASPGDLLEVDGRLWRIDWYRFGGIADRHNLQLELVEPCPWTDAGECSLASERAGGEPQPCGRH